MSTSATLNPWTNKNSLPARRYLWPHYLWEDSEGVSHPYRAIPRSGGRSHWRCWSSQLKEEINKGSQDLCHSVPQENRTSVSITGSHLNKDHLLQSACCAFSEPRVTSSDCFWIHILSDGLKIWKGAVNSLSQHPWESSYTHAAPTFPPKTLKNESTAAAFFKFHFSDKSQSDSPSSADSGVFGDSFCWLCHSDDNV